ncbi:hypothetical protein, partial [Dysgonomonas capnocytophagoides]|uniref:hypothetical protein n=1 Tax=Dysgonomonas capnocytophagoides TaxID=45254 RepID=UPI002A82F1EC
MEVQDNLQSFYNDLKGTGVIKNFPEDYNVFKSSLSNPVNARNFYNDLVKNGIVKNLPDSFEEFSSVLFGDNTNVPSKEGFWNSYTGDFIEKAGVGTAKFGASIYSALDHFNNVVLKPYEVSSKTNTDLSDSPALKQVLDEMGVPENERGLSDGKSWMKRQADNAYQYADTLNERSNRYNGKSFKELWKEGDYKGAVGDVFLQASESLAQSLAAMFGGTPGLILTGVSAGTNKYDELDKMPETKDLPEFQKIINAVSTGTFESLIEKLGSVPIGKWLKGLYSKFSKDVAEKTIKNGFENYLSKIYKKYGILIAPVGEGIEEASSQIAENATDYCTGVTNELNLLDGVPESFVYGAGGGAQFSTVALPMYARNRIKKAQARSQYRKAKEKVNEAFPGQDASEIAMGLLNMSPQAQTTALQNMVNDSRLSDNQKSILLDFAIKANVYQAYNSPEMQAKDRIAKIFENKINKKSGNIITAYDADNNPVYVLDQDGETCIVEYKDGTKKPILKKELLNVKEETLDNHLDGFVNRITSQEEIIPTEGVENVTENVIQNQIPQTGLGQMSYKGENVNIIENKVQDDGTILVENEGGEAMRVPAKDLEGLVEPEVPETTLQESSQSEENVQTEPTKEIPLTKAGKPDYNTMLETDPEMFASEWEKRSSPEKAKATLERQSENIGKRIEVLQVKVDKETDLNKIADIEDEIADFLHRKEIVDGV